MKQSESVLSKYLPPNCIDLVMPLLKGEPIEIKIKAPRTTKFGDYRFPKAGERHQISLNNNLNPYAFLVTLIHEVAHLKAFVNHGKMIKPHGSEWQKTFLELSKPFIDQNIFPDNLKEALLKSLQKGRASSCSDLNLFRELQKFEDNPKTKVEDLPEGTTFVADNKMIFKKGPKARKRYKCLNISNGRQYMVHPLAFAEVVENENTIINVQT